MFRNIKNTLRQIYESIFFAFESVIINKTRTFLSLLGITIGIFAIISVYTAIDTLESYVRGSLQALSSNHFEIGKWPWGPEDGTGEYKWWKYMNRPEVTEVEYREIQEITPEIKEAVLSITLDKTLKYENKSYDNIYIFGATENYRNVKNTKIGQGRYFTLFEFASGANNIIIGATVAQELFGNEDPVGKTIKVGNKKTFIIGVFEKEGTNMFGSSWDNQAMVPINYGKTFQNFRYSDPVMYLSPDDSIGKDDFKELIRARMRSLRRLPPTAEDNFSISDVGTINKMMDSIFVMINLAGGIIGILSILVGGFGVANIMFVSVRERTAQIGIQKALGAKPYAILLQYTFEAILLSIIGGIVGLFLIWILTFIVSSIADFEVILTLKNIMIGLGISFVVGAVSGIFPAYSAATMDPVTAIGKSA